MKKQFGSARITSLIGLSALSSFTLLPMHLHAQTTTGSILGSVTDSSGGAVPGVVVTITNQATGEKKTDATDGEGNYRVTNLIPGQYREDVEISGFKHFTREPITVEVESAVRVNVPLTVGAVTETVQVTGETPLLQTESAALSTVVNEKTVQEIPLNGRNPLNLIALTPGVVPGGSTAGASGSNQSAGHTNSAGWNNYQIGGGQPGQGSSFLDGAPINGLGGNTVMLVPTQDVIGEFRISVSAVSPEFGRFGGGVVNYATKSGGNSLHGTAYEYFRNKALNANSFFGKRLGQPKPAFNQNQYGGTFGGRIIKDKSFFFTSYEQYKIISGTTVNTVVPTAAERSGDFSADAPIYDPYSTVLNAAGTAVVSRTQFANNRILPSRFDPTANAIANVLQFYPLPNIVGAAPGANNYAATRNPGATSRQGTGRFDYNLNDKQHLFLRYTYWNLKDIPLNQFNNLTGGAGSDQRTHQAVIGYTYTLTPNLTSDTRVSFIRGFSDDNNPNLGRSFTPLGAGYATLQNQVTFAVNPVPTINGLGAFNGMGAVSTQTRNTFALAPSLAYQRGQHNFKAGADIRYLQFNYAAVNGNNASGTYAFNAAFTSSTGTTSAGNGNAFASFLLGTPLSGNLGTYHPAAQNVFYQGYYLSDTWRARQNLTLNLGVRYELPGAWTERHDLATVILPNLASPLGGNYKGGLGFVNSSNWNSRGTENSHYDLVAPRLGLNYNPKSDVVVSMGYGINYLPLDVYEGAMPFLSPINSATTTMVPSVNNAGLVPLNTLSSPFPAGGVVGATQQSVLEPSGRSQAYLNTLNGLSIAGPIPTTRFPYAQQWNASVQQQLPGSALFQVSYAGNRGTFLPLGSSYSTGSVNNLNQLPDQYFSMGSALLAKVANPLAGQVNPTGSLNGATVNAGQLLRPYPQYTDVTRSNSQGDSIYHALLVSFQKRFAGGGTFSSNYTWAKNIGNVSGTALSQLETGQQVIGALQDYTNPRAERSNLNTDVRNRFVTSFVAPLPFGRGHRFFAHASGLAGGLANGWEANAIATFQSGFPLSLVAQGNTLSGTFGAGTIRPNVNTNCINKAVRGSAQSRLNGWFNTSCFSQPADFTFGNEARVDSLLKAAGIANYDFSAAKNLGLSEHVTLQLKGEVYNLFNRVQFAPPGTTLGTGTFGVVSAASNQPRQAQVSARLLF